MSFFHGIKLREISTDNLLTIQSTNGTLILGRTPIQTTAGLPVIIGRAPVHLTENPAKYVNKPVICYTWNDAVEALGYSNNWDNYEICETMFAEFKVYGVKPVIFINVLDPAIHKTRVAGQMYNVENDEIVINDSALINSFVVKENSYSTTATARVNVDYTVTYDNNEKAVVSIIGGGILEGKTSLYIEYDKVNPSAVTYSDVIGGVNSNGDIKGMELIDMIYTQFGMAPGIIASPGWSENPIVAAVMKAKAAKVCCAFPCICLTDIDTTQVRKYSDAYAWKSRNSYNGANQVVCWPCVQVGEMIFHMSTHLLGVIGVMDSDNDDIPYMSPSNHAMQATGLCLKDGTEIMLNLDQANLLNEKGIVTGLNFSGGFKIWGNYTAVYPLSSDPKDIYICCRRMLNWLKVTFLINYWSNVDAPLIPRVVRSLVDNESIRLNGLVARGYLLSADIKFNDEENPLNDLLAGILRLHRKISAPVPSQEIDVIDEYDVSAYSTLFGAEEVTA